MLRRKRSTSPALAPFLAMAASLDSAQRALLRAIPTARDAGVPLADALAGFERGLDEAAARMPAWRDAATEEIHDRCLSALAAARVEAERLRIEPGRLEFEELNARIGDALHPLEVFADAERTLRRTRD